MRLRHETIGSIFDLVYLALATNLLLAVAWLPALAAMYGSWPLLALAAPFCAPGLCAVFAVFAAYSGERSVTVVRTFARAWRATARRAIPLGALTAGALVVLGVDIRAAWGHRAGALVIPVLAVLMTLVVATALLALVALAERPAARLRDVLRVGGYLAVRRWYLTLPSLAVLVLLEAMFTAQPALALALATSPLLYASWANSRFTLTPALGPVPRVAVPAPDPGPRVAVPALGPASRGAVPTPDPGPRVAVPARDPVRRSAVPASGASPRLVPAVASTGSGTRSTGPGHP
ncbi:hypothetical protein [Actinoplanes sp. NPDC051851]|uniref:hypothetical protein n=1 Tax=Actinoplanes sp. NPDC051851 TaxID=3154753 RepID=UPI003426ED29